MKNVKVLTSSSVLPLPSTNAFNENVSAVVTGQSAERMRLFAGIHKSKKFSIDAAYNLFVGKNSTK